MPDQTAHDAVRECFCGAAWCRTNGCPTFTICNAKADKVLAALGIPPDATVDDVRAGLAALRIARSNLYIVIGADRHAGAPGPFYATGHGESDHHGASPAAAVLALANKLEASGA